MAIPIPDIVSIPRAAPIDDRLFFIAKGIIHRMATHQEILKENDLLISKALKMLASPLADSMAQLKHMFLTEVPT